MANHLSISCKGKIYFLVIICSHLILFQGSHSIFALRNATYSHLALALDSVLLNCGGKAKTESRWIYNGYLLFTNKMYMDDRFGDTISLLPNYDLMITNVSLNHEGIYKCIRDSKTITTHSLTVAVLPSVELKFDGNPNSDSITIQQNTTLKSTCLAKGSRPPVYLTWKINNKIVDKPWLVTTKTFHSDDDLSKFDTETTLKFQPTFTQGNISCQMKALSVVKTYHASFHVEVQPLVKLTVNGQSSVQSIKVAHHKDVRCTCHAFKYSSQVNISWMVNSEIVDPTMVKINKKSPNTEYKDTFDTLSAIVFEPEVTFGSITCVVSTLRGKEYYHSSFYVQNITTILLPLASVCAMLCLMLCLWCICKRVTRTTGGENINHYEDLAMTRSSVASLFHLLQGIGQRNLAPKHTTRDNVCLKDVICTTKLPSEGNIVYWKARCTSSATGRIDILAKCMSGRATREEVVAFQTLGDMLSSFPEHEHIVTTLGVEITEGPYYIYQDYLDGGTLREFLLKCSQKKYKRNQDGATSIMTNMLLQIAEGMLFLSVRNYRHPALSSRKVLLDHGGRCALFDFWPQELSLGRVKEIIKKPNPPVAWLAPETNLCLQYCSKSDVWAFAIVIWEVFTFGGTPYTGMTGEEIAHEIRHNLFLKRPRFCPSNLFDVMLKAWNISREERPTFKEMCKHLKKTMKAETEEIDQDEDSFFDYSNQSLN